MILAADAKLEATARVHLGRYAGVTTRWRFANLSNVHEIPYVHDVVNMAYFVNMDRIRPPRICTN